MSTLYSLDKLFASNPNENDLFIFRWIFGSKIATPSTNSKLAFQVTAATPLEIMKNENDEIHNCFVSFVAI